MTAPTVAPTLRCTNCGCPGAVVTTTSAYVGGGGYQDRDTIACPNYDLCMARTADLMARGMQLTVSLAAERHNRQALR